MDTLVEIDDKKERLRICGKDLFSTQGFKKTNVAAITSCAGVAAGTFYLYYNSKEALFMEIYIEENRKLKEEIMAALDLNQEPAAVIHQLMTLNMEGMYANPILREWYNQEVFSKIEEKFREENGLESVDFHYDLFHDLVRRWQEEGKMRKDIDSKMIMALFTAMLTADLHKDEIGVEFFPEIQFLLTDFILKGLTPDAD